MENEEKENQQIETNQETSTTIEKLTKALEEERKNKISKEDYEAVESERNQLLDSIINGSAYNIAARQPTEKPNVDAILEKLNKPQSNLDFAKNLLELDNACKENDLPSPFVPNANAQDFDFAGADKFLTILKDCVDECHGDEQVFNVMWSSRVRPAPGELMTKGKLK